MHTRHVSMSVCLAAAVLGGLVRGGPGFAQTPAGQASATVPAGSKIWLAREADFEDYLRTAKIVRIENIPVGVTKPKRCYLEPGGLASSLVFKPLMASRRTGYWESYESEIAAYELSKLIGLDMVPPTVERRVDGSKGSAQLWVEHCTLLRDRDPNTAPDIGAWNRQVYRQRVWDNLIGNIDRNQGNLLVDQAWNLILIDHSRAFTSTSSMPFTMTKIDREILDRIRGLDQQKLEETLGKLLFDGPKPLLKRRDKIVKHFEELIAKYGEAGVYVP
jgi:hypothetical protein